MSDGEQPSRHRDPPPDLARRSLPLLTTSQPWFRIYGLAYAPLYFGKTGDNRFDLPDGKTGVCYVAADEAGAFVETLGHTTGTRVLTQSALRNRGIAELHTRRPLQLVDLTGAGLARVGADERLCTGDYTVAQRWSAAFFRHPQKPDGLCYRSRHDPDRRVQHCISESHGQCTSFGRSAWQTAKPCGSWAHCSACMPCSSTIHSE